MDNLVKVGPPLRVVELDSTKPVTLQTKDGRTKPQSPKWGRNAGPYVLHCPNCDAWVHFPGCDTCEDAGVAADAAIRYGASHVCLPEQVELQVERADSPGPAPVTSGAVIALLSSVTADSDPELIRAVQRVNRIQLPGKSKGAKSDDKPDGEQSKK